MLYHKSLTIFLHTTYVSMYLLTYGSGSHILSIPLPGGYGYIDQ
jgi:hypothetical protein